MDSQAGSDDGLNPLGSDRNSKAAVKLSIIVIPLVINFSLVEQLQRSRGQKQ